MVAMQFNLAYIAYSKARKKHNKLLEQGVTLVKNISTMGFETDDMLALDYMSQINDMLYQLQDALYQVEFLDTPESQEHCHDHCACLDEHDRIINLLYTAQGKILGHMQAEQDADGFTLPYPTAA